MTAVRSRLAAWFRGQERVQRAGEAVSQASTQAIDLLFPPQCAYCQTEIVPPHDGILLCGDCQRAVGPRDCPRCARCGASLGCPAPQCPWCETHDLQFDQVFALGQYVNTLRTMALQLKHPKGEALARALGRMIATRFATELSGFDPQFVVPVPMHWQRRFCRGGNSTETIAQTIAKTSEKYPLRGVLRMLRNTIPQKELRLRDRFRNVKGAFGVRRGYALAGARVLLVDDILTTGATCSAAAEVLKEAGAARVAVVVVARADHAEAQ